MQTVLFVRHFGFGSIQSTPCSVSGDSPPFAEKQAKELAFVTFSAKIKFL